MRYSYLPDRDRPWRCFGGKAMDQIERKLTAVNEACIMFDICSSYNTKDDRGQVQILTRNYAYFAHYIS